MSSSARRPILLTVLGATALGAVLAGCGASPSSSTAAGGGPLSGTAAGGVSPSASLVSGSITVLAASSLKETFTALGTQFEAAHPGATVTFSFGASSALATQITQGAPADVFASASTKNMDAVVAAKGAEAPTVFAKNVMQIALPPHEPGAHHRPGRPGQARRQGRTVPGRRALRRHRGHRCSPTPG